MAQTAQEFRTQLSMTAEKRGPAIGEVKPCFSTQLCSPVCACVSLWQELKWKKEQKKLKKQQKKAAEAAKATEKERVKEAKKAGLLFPEKGHVI